MTLSTKLGLILMTGSMSVWLTDRILHNPISSLFGKWSCGDRYLEKINGALSSQSCGFNADMQLTALLFLFVLVGLALTLATTVLFRSASYH